MPIEHIKIRNFRIKARLVDEGLRMIATKCIADEYKGKFSKFVASQLAEEACGFDFEPLRALVHALLEKLEVQTTVPS